MDAQPSGQSLRANDLGPKDLKGIAGLTRAWTALRASSPESRFEALHETGLTTLIGREEECEQLLRRWSLAKAGEGQVVLLSGEAGIGKSRLTAALLERLSGEPHTRLRYFCSPQHGDSALYPVIGQWSARRGCRVTTTLERISTSSTRCSHKLRPRLSTRRFFAEMLSLPNDGRYATLALAPRQRRQRTLEALVSQVATRRVNVRC